MSPEKHRQREQRHHEALRVGMGSVKIDWNLFIHDVAPPQDEVPVGGFIFSRQVIYHPSKATYSSRGINSLEESKLDCK